MTKNLIIAALLLAGLPSVAQNINYALSAVAEPVKKNAHTITRYENQVYEITELDKATHNVHRVETIIDSKGKSSLVFQQPTDKWRILDDVDIKVYDANGKQVGKYRKKDMNTVANGEGLIDDGYITYFEIPVPGYPVTVETKYEIKHKGTLGLPSFWISEPGHGTEISTFTAKVPKELDLRYKEFGTSIKPEVTEDAKFKVYKWTVSNVPPLEDEEGTASARYYYPNIQLAPNKFTQYGYTGDISTWKNFGTWLRDLYKGLDELPEARKNFYRDMVKNAADDREKIKIIYQYMQKNFRYVSIQLGIGGLRPFPAEFTDTKKYGDCKGLSNYVKGALKAVGIPSLVAIINRETNGLPVDPAFPANTFNHAILCVPLQKDTVWLECTSNTADFATLETTTENRNALLVTEDGGVLVRTPVSEAKSTQLHITSTIELEESGAGKVKTSFKASGSYTEMVNYAINEKKDDQKEFLVHGLGFKQPDEFELSGNASDGLHAMSLEMLYEKVPEFIAGNKFFVSPRLYKIQRTKMPKSENRKNDFYFETPFDKVDTTIFKLPAGFGVDGLPKAKELSCPYATYTTKYWFNEEEKAVYSVTQLVLKQHRIPAAQYAEVKKFFDEILLDDAQRIVIKKL